jgi:hypothetical protein
MLYSYKTTENPAVFFVTLTATHVSFFAVVRESVSELDGLVQDFLTPPAVL